MLRIGEQIYGTGVVHVAAYATTPHDPLETTERLLRDPSLQAVEGAWALDADRMAALRNSFAWSGVDAVMVVGGMMRRKGIDPSAADPEASAAAVAELKKLVETAAGLGCRMMLLCSGPDVAPDQRAAAVDRLAGVLEELCAHAKAVRPHDPLWLTFEHFDRELDQKRLLGPTVEAAALIERVRRTHANIGLTLDLSHIVQLGEDIAGAVAAAREVTIHAHVANCGLDRAVLATFGDSHCRFGAPGGAVGVDDVVTFLDALVRNGYGTRPLATRVPLISVEMKTPEGETPELAIAGGLRMLHRAAAIADAALRRTGE